MEPQYDPRAQQYQTQNYGPPPYAQPSAPYAQQPYGAAPYGTASYASPPPPQMDPAAIPYAQPAYVGDAEYGVNKGVPHDGEHRGFVSGGDGGPPNAQVGNRLQYDQDPSGVTGWRDIWFFVIFMIHIIIMIILAGVHGPTMIDDAKNSSSGSTGSSIHQPPTDTIIGLLVVAAVIGAAFSLFWLGLMKRYATQMIHISLVVSILLSIAGAIISFAVNQIAIGVIYIVFAILGMVYYFFVRERIPFATAVLASSVQAIQENSGPIWVVYLLTIVQIAWLAFWAFVTVSVWNAGNRVIGVDMAGQPIYAENTSGLQFLQAFCIFSLYWTMQVIRNIGHMTTAGTVASWWFTPSVESPTKPSFVRATTTSIGSICFASLIVALIETTRALLRQARKDACRDIVDCILSLIERAVKYFNKYALCTAAIYGTSFMQSARRTADLFKAELFTAVINDDLSGGVLFLGAFIAGIIAGVIGGVWAAARDMDAYILWGFLAFLVGILIAALAMSVIQSAIATTFVAWATDPAALHANRPVEFGRIIEAGKTRYERQGINQYSGQQHP